MAAIMRLLFFILCPLIGLSQKIVYDHASPQAAYAAGRLQKALATTTAAYTIQLSIDSSLQAESYTIQSVSATGGAASTLTITGGDARGLIYGSLSLAESIGNGVQLQQIAPSSEHPHLPFRAIKFDLPWDTYRHSYALDQHIPTCRDTLFWQAFLDMMVNNRFNILSLWNLHPYPFMIRARNFPEACPFTEKELKEWQALFHSIFRMAKERAIDTYLIPFNIFVSPEFARAHQVALDNLQHHFFVNGDTSEIIKRYTRESVTQVLREYPELTGFGLTLGEGMGGMTPQQREDWMKETIIKGMQESGRKTKLIHRIPFSSGTGSLGVTSIATEQLTRKAIDEEGHFDFLEGPIWADLKYNWSHPLSTTKLIKVHGGKLYDTYFKPLPSNYRIVWTARNEDIFCLRWGVPDFIRSHIGVNNQAYVGGYFIGSESYIPAKDYFTALPAGTSVKAGPAGSPANAVDWRYAFQRQWLFYKLWGRLLYNPATPDSIFQAEFIRRYGKQAASLLEASSLAGRTPLRLGADFDFTWDFSLYSEGFLALDTATKRVDYISVDRLIHHPPADPDYMSVKDYVDTVLAGISPGSERITPLILADQLEKDCRKALDLVKAIKGSAAGARASTPGARTSTLSLQYEVADIRTWSWLGLHFAHQLRGAVALEKYRRQHNTADQQQAISFLQAALKDWDTVIAITRPIYKDMPLTHLSEQNGVRSPENAKLRWHWAITRKDVARDIEIARAATGK